MKIKATLVRQGGYTRYLAVPTLWLAQHEDKANPIMELELDLQDDCIVIRTFAPKPKQLTAVASIAPEPSGKRNQKAGFDLNSQPVIHQE